MDFGARPLGDPKPISESYQFISFFITDHMEYTTHSHIVVNKKVEHQEMTKNQGPCR